MKGRVGQKVGRERPGDLMRRARLLVGVPALLVLTFLTHSSQRVGADEGSTAGVSERVRGAMDRAALAEGDPRRYAEAVDAYREAAEIARDAGEPALEIGALQSLFDLHFERSDFLPLRELGEQRLEAWRRTGDAAGIASAENDLGATLALLGDARGGAARLARALSQYRALNDEAGRAQVLTNLAVLHLNGGEYSRAYECSSAAFETYAALKDVTGQVLALNGLGCALNQMGERERARQVYERALKLVPADDFERRVLLLGNLAVLRYEAGDLESARESLTAVLRYYRKAGNRPKAALVLLHLGRLALRAGAASEARAQLETAKGMADRSDDTLGFVHVAIASCDLHLGRPKEALASLHEAKELAVESGSLDLGFEARKGLAEAYLALGDAGRSMEEVKKAAALLRSIEMGLGDLQAVAHRGRRYEPFETGLRAALVDRRPEDVAYFLELGRAMALVNALGLRAGIDRAGGSEATAKPAREARDALGAAHARVMALRASGAALPEVREAIAHRETAEQEYEVALTRRQAEAFGGSATPYDPVTSLEGMRATLRPKEVLVLYGVLPERTYALVVTPRREEARVVDLGETAQILAAVERATDVRQERASQEAALRDAGALLLRPLGIPPETKRILVGPQGPLNEVPFAAVLAVLEPRPTTLIGLMPSVGAYRLLSERRARKGTRVLALGDPVYRQHLPATTQEVYRGRELTPLPKSREEVDAVASQPEDRKLLGAAATRKGLFEAIAEATRDRPLLAVHIACHGLIDRDDPFRCALALTPADESDDGMLTVPELFERSVPADLAVLSACESGLGPLTQGEGIAGFARAFLFAGCPRVLVSLWKVDDAATSALMDGFYRALRAGKEPAAALAQAQDETRRNPAWGHPKYWAAWVLWGLPD